MGESDQAKCFVCFFVLILGIFYFEKNCTKPQLFEDPYVTHIHQVLALVHLVFTFFFFFLSQLKAVLNIRSPYF